MADLSIKGDIMFAPIVQYNLGGYWGEQKNIIEDRFSNLRPHERYRPWHYVGHDPKVIEQHTRLRLWKLLREMDVPPVFLLHLEEELYTLVKRKTDKEKLEPKPKCTYHRIKEALEKVVCNCEECK